MGLFFQIFSSAALISLGLYHLICTTRNYLKSPHSYIAKPYYPLSSSNRFKYLQLYLLILCLLIALVHQTLISSYSDPLLKGSTPVHRFTSLQSAAVLFLFLILSLSLLLSDSTSLLPLPSDLFFALASAVFFLQSSSSSSSASVQTSDLQSKCDSISAQISGLSAVLCLILACQPRMFVADVGLGGAVCLQGLWMLQTGLSLYAEAFIPDGCHKLLDVVSGVEGSTKCDLEDSRLRAVAILDLVFVVHVMFVVLIVMVIYGVVAKTFGVGVRKLGGSYEALPTTASSAADSSSNHFQMKALTGTQA
ncbi:unnamed protein product [Dovyalis caffra]|uniref:Plant viral-response family protein n=1 Tax=Dovyalis caffra TaxID=77055 RepID=A0AAV1S9L1_9ROSI|nr:unnamed protein product [Dovyalis caffra]